jgi:lipoprotein-releasing system ATP-binding protein
MSQQTITNIKRLEVDCLVCIGGDGALGMAKVKNNMANKMSGGQQQRTAIARALINNPKVIVADEPTGNLDSENTTTIYRIFREMNQQFGTTFLIVTHDRRIAEEADRIVEIKDGRTTADVNK